MKEKELMEYQRTLPKIDTHEHIAPEKYAVGGAFDIFDVLLIPYNCDTIRSAGCTGEEWAVLADRSQEFGRRYSVLEKYIPSIQYTAFFRAARQTLKMVYGESEITEAALLRADLRLKEELKKPHYALYQDTYHIEEILHFSGYDCMKIYEGEETHYVPTVSEILPRGARDIRRLEEASGAFLFDLNSLRDAVDKLFERYARHGVKAVKFGSAYRRKLDFAAPDFAEAQRQLQSVLGLRQMGDSRNSGGPEPCFDYSALGALDDYLTDYMITLCRKYRFTVVFHTAMHAWNENDPERAHCHYLTPLIQRYGDVRFVLLHAGAPYFEEAVLLARYFTNVYLDLTWFHIISPRLAREAVLRILELVPVNKVFAFGGDYCYIQTLPGHLEMAMQNFAAAFGKAIDEGILEENDAKRVLKAWYYENPKRVFLI